jgi:hypothetical protein
MAISSSMLHRGFSGTIGDLIYRNYNGKTVVSLRPFYKNETNTEAQDGAGKFREATNFASKAMADEKLKAYYMQKAKQLKLPNAYTAAITDFLRKAKVRAVTRSTFSGKKNDSIIIKVNKGVFMVCSMKVSLCDSAGKILAEQTLTRFAKGFTFVLPDDFPDFGQLVYVRHCPSIRLL